MKKTILVADDDQIIVDITKQALENAGYTVVTAADGKEALAICQRNPIDLAILDVKMPGLSGFEVAEKLGQDVPFIFLSAYDDDQYFSQASMLGALGYMLKPVDIKRILASVQVALATADERNRAASNLELIKSSSKTVNTAIGILMAVHRLTDDEAFKALRDAASRRQEKIVALSKEIVDQSNNIFSLKSIR